VDGYCKLFSALLSKLQFECFLDTNNPKIPFVKLLLYGTNIDAIEIAQKFVNVQVIFSDPGTLIAYKILSQSKNIRIHKRSLELLAFRSIHPLLNKKV
jgi:hypothetical protein